MKHPGRLVRASLLGLLLAQGKVVLAQTNNEVLSQISPEPPCAPENEDQICEIVPATNHDWVPYLNELIAIEDYNGEFHAKLVDNNLTIFALNPGSSTFVCCDIQSPVRVFKADGLGDFHFAQFRIPRGGFFELLLLGQDKFVGPSFLYETIDPFQRFYIDSLPVKANPNIYVYRSENFERDIFIYRFTKHKAPEGIVYLKDGVDIYGYVGALEILFKSKGQPLPNIALVGFASGESEVRSREYVRWGRQDEGLNDAYEAYSRNFRDILVPEIERHLGYKNGAEGRVLSGKSAGGAWAVSFALDNPGFANTVWAYSPAGQPSEIMGEQKHSPATTTRFFLGVGRFEGAFTADTKVLHRDISLRGFRSNLEIKNSGHNQTTWVPLFLRHFEETFQIAS